MTTTNKIREIRKTQGLTIKELANIANISKGYLSQIETQHHKQPSAHILSKLADALNTTIAELLNIPTPQVPDELNKLFNLHGKRLNLKEEDIRMLANIRYRGRQPQSMNDWEYVYMTIRLIIGGKRETNPTTPDTQ